VYRLAYNGDVVAFKMGRRQGKRVGGSAYWRIGVSGDAFSQRVAVAKAFVPLQPDDGKVPSHDRVIGSIKDRVRCTLII
jgi:hypothetical protein